MLPTSPAHAGPRPPCPSAPWHAAQPARPGQLAGRARRRPTPPPLPSRVGRSRHGESSPHATTPRSSGSPSASHAGQTVRAHRRAVWQRNRRFPRHRAVTMLREPAPRTQSAVRRAPRSRRATSSAAVVGRRRRRRARRARSRDVAGAQARRRRGRASPAGHGSSPSQRGPRRTGGGRQPGAGRAVPRPRRRRRATSAPRRRAHGSTPGCGRAVSAGTPGQPRAGVVDDGLDDPGLVGDEHLRHEQVGGPAPHRRR